jgi:hypothetical protein
MNLLELRTQLVKVTGRNDLVNGSADNGANFYINAGQRFLDRKYRFPKDTGIYPDVLEVGKWHVTVPYCRAIQAVWIANSNGRIRLEKKNVTEFLTLYPTVMSSVSTGTPAYYCPAILRSIPESDRATADTMRAVLGYMPTMVGDHYSYNGILIGPPTDQKIHVEIHGLFYSPDLLVNDDQSFWSAVHPEILIFAAAYEMEIVHRNTQGANDWLGAIEQHFAGVDQDTAEEDAAEVDQMEG